MFAVRALTAAALIGALLSALFLLERTAFAVVVAAIVALGGHEWARLAGLQRATAYGYAAACALAFAAFAWWDHLLVPVLWTATLFWAGVAPWWLARGVRASARGWLPATGIAVLVPAGLAMSALPPARLLMLLGLVWIADTAAYLAGRAFGRHPLAPAISPAKTWEGVAGAASVSLIYAIICALLDPALEKRVQGAFWLPYLGGAALLCAASIVGDLFESALKRQAGAKDSGALLPGHGGVLDRIDSATATLPLGALLMHSIGAT